MRRFIVRVRAASLEGLQDLQRVFDVDVVRASGRQIESGFAVEALVSESEIEKLRKKGYQVEILDDADEVARQRRKDVG